MCHLGKTMQLKQLCITYSRSNLTALIRKTQDALLAAKQDTMIDNGYDNFSKFFSFCLWCQHTVLPKRRPNDSFFFKNEALSVFVIENSRRFVEVYTNSRR